MTDDMYIVNVYC